MNQCKYKLIKGIWQTKCGETLDPKIITKVGEWNFCVECGGKIEREVKETRTYLKPLPKSLPT